MKAKRLLRLLPVAVLALLLASCFDSKVPLSEPGKAKADEQLAGVWRFRGEGGEMTYYHVGRAGEKYPTSAMRAVSVQHTPDGKMQHGELLVFPTTLGGKSYLNVAAIKPSQLALLEEKGWSNEAVNAYLILRYSIKGDVLAIQLMDNEAKKRAIESGSIKGVIEKDQGHFTDSSGNLARFVASAGDALFSKDVLRLERVR